MNKIKKSIILFLIFTLVLSINYITKAEDIIEDEAPNTEITENEEVNEEVPEEETDDINESLDEILSTKGIPSELTEKIEETSINDGNYFNMSGDSIKIDSEIDGDVFIISGKKVTIDSYIAGNAFICANEVEITSNAEISSSLFCAAKDIKIYGEINLNSYCASESFTLAENAYIYKNLYLISQKISLDGLIEGTAFISGENIEIMQNCNIEGDLNYASPKQLEIPESAVRGNVKYSNNTIEITKKSFSNEISDFIRSAISYVAFGIIVFLILNLLKVKLTDNFEDFKSNIGKYILFGCLALFITPILNIIILFIPFLARFAFLVLGIYILLLLVASIITIITLSKICANKFKETIKVNDILRSIIFIAILGIVYRLLKLIPVLGFFVTLASVIFGIGITIKNTLPKKETNNQ